MSSSGEIPAPFGRDQEETREAFDYCESIRHAVELNDAATRLHLLAQRAAGKVILSHILGELPYDLAVAIPADNEAYVVSDDDDIVVNQPTEFMATEVRSISHHGIEFYNRNTRERLVLSTSDFELSPIFHPTED